MAIVLARVVRFGRRDAHPAARVCLPFSRELEEEVERLDRRVARSLPLPQALLRPVCVCVCARALHRGGTRD